MENMFYCSSCEELHDTKIIEKEQTLSVKGKNITLAVRIRVCQECGEEILDEELDNETLSRFYDEYRRLENLLLPSEIKTIRQRYNLSQSSFAKLLGFGEKTITRYENGAIQDACHDNLIRLMDSWESFVLIWKERKDVLSEKEQLCIDCKVSMYNKFKIKSIYTDVPQYYTTSNIIYSTQGGLGNAG